MFSREGEYKRATPVADEFSILKIGMFPSGTLLAFGYDRKDHGPRLVMLKEDGTLLKSLEIPKSDAPASMVSDSNAPHPHSIAMSQMVSSDHTIIIYQTEGDYPLLEISEGGNVRAVRPLLPNGEQTESLIPADKNIYMVARSDRQKGNSDAIIYEVSPSDGALIRSFKLGDGPKTPDSVACINDGKFLSIDYGNGKVVPLIGTAEPATGVKGEEAR